MRILIISDAWHPQLNGVVRTYEALIEPLERKGHDVSVIGPDAFKRCVPLPGYSEIKIALAPYRALAKKIDAYQADTIHIATEGSLGWAARRYCLRHNIRFTTCYHSKFPEYVALRMNAFMPFLSKWAFHITLNIVKKFHAPASALLVTTQSMATQLKKYGFTAPIHIFTRGVDQDIFKPGDAHLFQDLKKPIALYVGRLAVEKNIEDFLNMNWAGSKVVVGHGPDENKLKDQYPDVIFTGKKEGLELSDHYRSADVFVFPSRTDTFGMVLIEALACGLPIAAYNVTGPCDVVIDEALGNLSEDLSQAAHKALEQGTAEARHQHVKQHYSWDKAAEQFLEAQKTTF